MSSDNTSHADRQPNIYQRINKVMQEVQYVQKDKAVSGGGVNYKAVTHDQVVSVIRKSMVNNGIVISVEQIEGEFITKRDMNATPQPVKMGLYRGFYKVNFVNMDKPDDQSCISVEAHAQDNGDKAPGKCMTYAVKTAVLKQFFLETGENDESREEERDLSVISETQQAELFDLLCDTNGQYTGKGLKVARAFKFSNLEDIKSSKFDRIKAVAIK